MTDVPASDRYRVLVDEAERPQLWFRSIAVVIANIASWFDGFTTGPVNPGGRTIKVIDNSTGKVVLEFVEEFGDDARWSLSTLQSDVESLSIGEFEAKWL